MKLSNPKSGTLFKNNSHSQITVIFLLRARETQILRELQRLRRQTINYKNDLKEEYEILALLYCGPPNSVEEGIPAKIYYTNK